MTVILALVRLHQKDNHVFKAGWCPAVDFSFKIAAI